MSVIRKLGVLSVAAAVMLFAAGCASTSSNMAGIPGLKASYCFNEGEGNTVTNSVGPGTGKVMGGLKWVDGKEGKALSFDGKGYVLIDHSDCFNAPAFTIAAWTKLKDTYDFQYIVWKNGPEFPDVGPGRRFDLWVDDMGMLNAVCHLVDNTENYLIGATSIADDSWHHVAKVYDGTSIKLYVDGALDAEEKLSGKMNPKNDTKMWIGARPGDVAASGVIDNVMFFNRALTKAEINKLSSVR